MISRFFFPVFFIGLGGFLPSFHFPSTIPRLAELASEKKGNYNNIIFKNSRNGSYMTTIIQKFTLVSFTTTVIPYLVGLSLKAAVLSIPIHLSFYALDFSLLCLCTSRKNNLLGYLSEIVHLSKYAVCHPQLLQYTARKLSCWLDAIDAFSLCGNQPCHQYSSE